MGFTSVLALLVLHPIEFTTLLRYKLFYKPKRNITAAHEHPTTGWDRKSMRRCWELLDMTSRSFSVVIKELEGDLARAVRICV
jgi:farnesyl-diphosphate farnesyltransferase